MKNIRKTVESILKKKNLSKRWLATQMEISEGNVNRALSNVSIDNLEKITNALDVKVDFLLGEKENTSNMNNFSHLDKNDKKIPFYDEVSSIGGSNDSVANMSPVSSPTDYIDAGDWFREATAAIRHYGSSMPEYPPGCILTLKEVLDRSLVIPGRDYVIETSEYRVTKRLQLGKTDDHILAYSTNIETHPDGKLIHEPFPIKWKNIKRISLVLGYVVKTNGGTMVYNNNK